MDLKRRTKGIRFDLILFRKIILYTLGCLAASSSHQGHHGVSAISNNLHDFYSLFADDTKIHSALYDVHNSCTTSLQEDLDRLQNWTVDMQMRFHPAKCRTMHLGKHNPNTEYALPIDDGTLHEIAKTAEDKDLGVTIDDKLIFSPDTFKYKSTKLTVQWV